MCQYKKTSSSEHDSITAIIDMQSNLLTLKTEVVDQCHPFILAAL